MHCEVTHFMVSMQAIWLGKRMVDLFEVDLLKSEPDNVAALGQNMNRVLTDVQFDDFMLLSRGRVMYAGALLS